MLNGISRPSLLGGIWLVTVAVIVASSVAMGARLSTSAFLFAMCAVPMGVVLAIGLGAPAPTVAELLHTVDTRKDGRS